MKRAIQTTLTASAIALFAPAEDAPAARELALEEGRRPKAVRVAPTDAAPAGTFELGQLSSVLDEIAVAGTGWDGSYKSGLSQSTVTARDVFTFNKNTLDDAVNILPGVSASNTGGSRNERLIFVRGFDRLQVPLSIDGIRVYLPADNRLDFGRFLTPDLSEIQVQKGYVSVLNGPGGMGGAINLVTRKPVREAEAEFRTGFEVGNRGIPSAFNGFGIVGTRQETYYLQASGTIRDTGGFFLSQGFRPQPLGLGGPIEVGGRRDFAATDDYRINLKAALTPNATDEYSLSYTKQSGAKGAPYSIFEPVRGITPTPLPRGTVYQRDWRWPYWDLDSLYFLSRTAIGDQSYLLTRAYHNTFNNLLSAFDDATFRTQTQPRSFDSFYDDVAYGGSFEFGTELIPFNTFKAAGHYRRDRHSQRQLPAPGLATSVFEPRQISEEDTVSIAAENNFHATDRLDLVVGLSYDRNELLRAQDFDAATRRLSSYPLGGTDALNVQGAAIYRTTPTGRVHASVSSRTRFPTLFERFSTRFGDAVVNPALSPERSTNFEVGFSEQFWNVLRVTPAAFYSDLENTIQSVSIGNNQIQNQNIGTGRFYGYEVAAELTWSPELFFGANYTFLIRELDDPLRPNLRATGVPRHQAFLYATWAATPALSITPSLELASSRFSSDRLENNFFQTPGFALLNLQAQYALDPTTTWAVGMRNLLDTNYSLAFGFPEFGRTVFTNLRMTF